MDSISQENWVGAKKTIDLPTGLKMKYVEMGPADGKVIIFLHGMTDNSRNWSLIAPYFVNKFHIFMPDQRGHGDTDKPDLRMYPTCLYAQDLAAFMDLKGLKKAHIVGHSLGSMIAQDFAVNYPEKVDKLVLVSSAPVEFASLGREIYDVALALGDKQPDDAFMAEWYANPIPVDEDFLKREMAESQNLPPHAWRAITKGAAYSHLIPFMDELKSPTLIIWGGQDPIFGEEAQKSLKKLIPQAAFIAYEKSGHNPQWENSEKMAQDVRAFLEKR